jgi:hypothetical protein
MDVRAAAVSMPQRAAASMQVQPSYLQQVPISAPEASLASSRDLPPELY